MGHSLVGSRHWHVRLSKFSCSWHQCTSRISWYRTKQLKKKSFWEWRETPAIFRKENRIKSHPSTPPCPQFSDSLKTQEKHPKSMVMLYLLLELFFHYLLRNGLLKLHWRLCSNIHFFFRTHWTLSLFYRRIKCFLISIHKGYNIYLYTSAFFFFC